MTASSRSMPAAPSPPLNEAQFDWLMQILRRNGFFDALVKAAVDCIAQDPQSLADLREFIRKTPA